MIKYALLALALLTSLSCRHKVLEQNMVILEERVALLEAAVNSHGAAINLLGELHTPASEGSPDEPENRSDASLTTADDVPPQESEHSLTEDNGPTDTDSLAGNEVESKASSVAPETEPLQTMPEVAEPTRDSLPSNQPFPTAAQEEVAGNPSEQEQKPTSSEPPPIDVEDTYKRSLQAYFDGENSLARTGFTAILNNQPEHNLAPNAAYWLAEVAYSENAFPKAQDEFQKVLDQYPASSKAPDALLKIGKCQEHLGLADEAIATYQKVIQTYPDSPSAKLAKSWF